MMQMAYSTKVDRLTRCGRLRFNTLWRIGWLALALAVCSLFTGTVQSAVLPAISQIRFPPDSAGVAVTLDGPAPFRAMLVDAKEALIAFQGVQISEKILKEGEKAARFEQLTINRLPNDVVTLVVVTTRDMQQVHSSWDPHANTMTARFIFKETERGPFDKLRLPAFKKPLNFKKKKSSPIESAQNAIEAVKAADAEDKKRSRDSKAKTAEVISEDGSPPGAAGNFELSIPIEPILAKGQQTEAMEMRGGLDDLLPMMTNRPCRGKLPVQTALQLCGNGNWQQALDLLNKSIAGVKEDECLEQAYYLRAYAGFKNNLHADEQAYLEAIGFFQDALSYYPSSVYAPFAMAGTGKSYLALKNSDEAKGYFKILLNTYKDYSGRPEVLNELGQLYVADNKLELSIALFKEFLSAYSEHPLALEVTSGFGAALYELNRYSEALEMLNAVLAKDPRMAFQNERLLVLIGGCYYQLGKFEAARDALAKAVNLFPHSQFNPTSLTRIGDTYRDMRQPEKAIKIYQLTMDTYPNTDGFIISAIRKAGLLTDPSEKKGIFKQIIDGYPTHPMAKLAVVKLADLYQKEGEYRKSIETIRPLMMERPKELLEEAAFIMQASFEGLLRKMLKEDAYPEIVMLHQKERGLLRRFNNPNILQIIGEAYLRGHLHAEAAILLKKAEDLFGADSPPELHYQLAVALQAANESGQALSELNQYVQSAPEGVHMTDAFSRMGRILIDRGDPKQAISLLDGIYRKNPQAVTMIPILRLLEEAHRLLGQYDQAADRLAAAADLFAGTSDKNADTLAETFHQLGEDYLLSKSYGKAIDAFTAALKFGGKTASPRMMLQLGEAYQKAGDADKAKNLYRQILTQEDEFWKYQAKERLQRLTIENRIGL